MSVFDIIFWVHIYTYFPFIIVLCWNIDLSYFISKSHKHQLATNTCPFCAVFKKFNNTNLLLPHLVSQLFFVALQWHSSRPVKSSNMRKCDDLRSLIWVCVTLLKVNQFKVRNECTFRESIFKLEVEVTCSVIVCEITY